MEPLCSSTATLLYRAQEPAQLMQNFHNFIYTLMCNKITDKNNSHKLKVKSKYVIRCSGSSSLNTDPILDNVIFRAIWNSSPWKLHHCNYVHSRDNHPMTFIPPIPSMKIIINQRYNSSPYHTIDPYKATIPSDHLKLHSQQFSATPVLTRRMPKPDWPHVLTVT